MENKEVFVNNKYFSEFESYCKHIGVKYTKKMTSLIHLTKVIMAENDYDKLCNYIASRKFADLYKIFKN